MPPPAALLKWPCKLCWTGTEERRAPPTTARVSAPKAQDLIVFISTTLFPFPSVLLSPCLLVVAPLSSLLFVFEGPLDSVFHFKSCPPWSSLRIGKGWFPNTILKVSCAQGSPGRLIKYRVPGLRAEILLLYTWGGAGVCRNRPQPRRVVADHTPGNSAEVLFLWVGCGASATYQF